MNKDRPSNSKQRLIKSLCIVVILVCAVSIYRTSCAGRPKPDKQPVVDAGQMVATETLKLMGGKGTVVIVAMDNSYSTPQVKAFRKTIEKQQGASVAAIEYVTTEQLAKGTMGSALSGETFLRLTQKYPTATVIASLVGPPVLSDQEIDKLDSRMPKLVVFAPMGVGIRKLLEEQVIQVAIVPRVTPLMTPTPPGVTTTSAPLQKAERFYEVITPQTAQSQPVFEPPIPLPKSK